MIRASSTGRLALCAGSRKASEGQPERLTEWALEGTALHQETQTPVDYENDKLSSEQNRTVRKCKLIVDDMRRGADWFFTEHHLETELGKHHLVGHIDAIARHGDLLVIYDWKFTWDRLLAELGTYQLKAYIVLAMRAYESAQRVVAKIYQPRTDEELEIEFDRADLPQLEQELIKAYDRSYEEDAPLEPGEEQCRHCPGQIDCPAILSLMKRHAPANTPQEIRRLHESLPRAWAAEKWAKNVKDFAKAVLKKDPDALPGFYLKPRRYPREVRDKTLLYESVKGCLSPRELMECSKVHIKKIEEKWLDRMNETTGRTKYKLKKEFADMVARALEPEQWYNVLTRKGDDRVRRREALDQGERPETIRSLGVTKGVRDSHGHERRSAKNA